jgi:hypothetical protein
MAASVLSNTLSRLAPASQIQASCWVAGME